MGLFLKNKKNRLKTEIKGYENGKEVKPKNGKSEEINAISYYQILEKEIKPLEDVLVGFSTSLRSIKNKQDRIDVLSALIENYDVLKQRCFELGADYEKYFSKTWEHCHNSRCSDFSFVERYEKELNELRCTPD